jgi:hypothetical protein
VLTDNGPMCGKCAQLGSRHLKDPTTLKEVSKGVATAIANYNRKKMHSFVREDYREGPK